VPLRLRIRIAAALAALAAGCTDVKMPGVNGLDVLRTITRAYPDTKVILMTGHGSAEDIELGLRLGAAACLQKPVDLETLLEAAWSAASGGEAADGEG